MSVRLAVIPLLVLVAPAAADNFGGFSGVDRPYLVNSDRVCKPIKVEGTVASGAPSCEKATADVVAKLSIKAPIAQTGNPNAKFTATANGSTLTVSRKTGEVLFTWKTMDPITKVIDVYAAQYDDRIAVAYNVRAMGKEQTNVVGFDLLKPGSPPQKDPLAKDPTVKDPANDPNAPKDPNTGVAPDDPKVVKAVEAATKAAKGKQLAAWQAVLAIDPGHSETLFRIAVLQMGAKQTGDAMRQLELLAKSTKPDAMEWLIEARFDPAFASLRGDPKFRAATGLDRKPTTTYERVMIFGGQWERAGTSCDKAEVKMKLSRNRDFKLSVKTVCQGGGYEIPFKGKWRAEPTGIVLILPNKGKATTADEAKCPFEVQGDEDALHCDLGKGIDFVVLPARR